MTRFPFRATVNGQTVVVEKIDGRTFAVDGRARRTKLKMRPSRENRLSRMGHLTLDFDLEERLGRD